MAKGLALIIEDHREIGDIYVTTLQLAGFETELIMDGKTALARLEGIVPRVIILDINLPQVSGNYIYSQIKSDSRLQNVPVVISTANMLLADVLRADLRPGDQLLIKPVSPYQLKDAMAKL